MTLGWWVKVIKDVPCSFWSYCTHHDMLTTEDWNHPTYGEAIVIWSSERKDVLMYHTQRSPRHNKMLAASLELCLLAGYEHGHLIINMICKMCQCYHPQQPHQLLQLTPIPQHLWQTLLTDLLHFNGQKWLVTNTFYSKMPIVWWISHCNVTQQKKYWSWKNSAEHGVLDSVKSDGGP